MAAGCARRGTDRGLGGAGEFAVEDGGIRVHPLFPALATRGIDEPGGGADHRTLSIIAIVYGALISLMQRDWKRLIAYSSVSHMGFCTLGIFALNSAGITGSVLQQLNHGITTGLLFLLLGMIYERRHTREIAGYGGVAHVMPRFAVVFAIAAFASAGLPMLNGFVGEFTILQGAVRRSPDLERLAAFGIVLSSRLPVVAISADDAG